MPNHVIDRDAEDAVHAAMAQVTVLRTRDIATIVRRRAGRARRARGRRRALGAGLSAVVVATVSICACLYLPAVRRVITGNGPSTTPVLVTTRATANVPAAKTAPPASRAMTPTAYPPTATAYQLGGPAESRDSGTHAEATALVSP